MLFHLLWWKMRPLVYHHKSYCFVAKSTSLALLQFWKWKRWKCTITTFSWKYKALNTASINLYGYGVMFDLALYFSCLVYPNPLCQLSWKDPNKDCIQNQIHSIRRYCEYSKALLKEIHEIIVLDVYLSIKYLRVKRINNHILYTSIWHKQMTIIYMLVLP